jgi:ElaB/YqjD/DUF883 family membrane-anchored ribosome-binding protein
MQQNNAELTQNFDVLREDITRLRTDMGEMLTHLAGGTKSNVAVAKEKLKGTGKKALTYSENTIKERPISSVVVLFLVGLVMGWLLDRKMSA